MHCKIELYQFAYDVLYSIERTLFTSFLINFIADKMNEHLFFLQGLNYGVQVLQA